MPPITRPDRAAPERCPVAPRCRRREPSRLPRSSNPQHRRYRSRRADLPRRAVHPPSSPPRPAEDGRSRWAPSPIQAWRARWRRAPARRRQSSSAPPPWRCSRRHHLAVPSSIALASPICRPARRRAPAPTSTGANCPASWSPRAAPDRGALGPPAPLSALVPVRNSITRVLIGTAWPRGRTVLHQSRRMHARRRGRVVRRGAEGATAPETLRQKDRGR